MFLSELNAEQKRAFLVLARQVIAADERLAMQELIRLEALYHEAGVPAETPDAPDVVADLNYMFPDDRARAITVLELLLIAHADRVVDDRELNAIREIVGRMDMDEGTWLQLREWAHRYAALVEEARAFGEG